MSMKNFTLNHFILYPNKQKQNISDMFGFSSIHGIIAVRDVVSFLSSKFVCETQYGHRIFFSRQIGMLGE